MPTDPSSHFRGIRDESLGDHVPTVVRNFVYQTRKKESHRNRVGGRVGRPNLRAILSDLSCLIWRYLLPSPDLTAAALPKRSQCPYPPPRGRQAGAGF